MADARVFSRDYAKMWLGAGFVGTLAQGIARIGGDLLYTDKGWPVAGWVLDHYFMTPQAGFEIVVTTGITMLGVGFVQNADFLQRKPETHGDAPKST